MSPMVLTPSMVMPPQPCRGVCYSASALSLKSGDGFELELGYYEVPPESESASVGCHTVWSRKRPSQSARPSVVGTSRALWNVASIARRVLSSLFGMMCAYV
jgi:hypothetical protein